MNTVANNICQRLSLRKPLAEALDLTSRIVDNISLQKPPKDEAELRAFLKELAEVKAIVPTVKDFDRDFPSLAFSIATGIGKTRLMGAIIAYLYLKKGIRHFFILAPNLTLYDVDYDTYADLLYKLANQAVEAIRINSPGLSADDIAGKVHTYREPLAARIYEEMCANSHVEKDPRPLTRVIPFSRILDQHVIVNEFGYRMVGDTPAPVSWAKKYVVKGFLKSYYPEYRFDSLTEWDFAFALEHDGKVLRWLRPVPRQFNIYWADGSKRYEPDFIVETADAIYMCETKAEKDVSGEDVKAKADAARNYCAIVSAYNARHGGKQWKYVIIPHTAVKRNFSFDYIIGKSNLYIS